MISINVLLDMLLECVAALCGTLAYGFIFNIRGKKLWLGALGGMFSWTLLLVLRLCSLHDVPAYFIVSLVMTLYSEILARKVKTPSTTFCIVTLVPLIPGGTLYYTMSYALASDAERFAHSAALTLKLSLALSLGIVLVTAASRQISKYKAQKHH